MCCVQLYLKGGGELAVTAKAVDTPSKTPVEDVDGDEEPPDNLLLSNMFL